MGLDILFVEPDRLSPDRVAESLHDLPPDLARALAALPSTDRQLADALRLAPTVSGLGPSNEAVPPAGPVRSTVVRELGADPRPYLPAFDGLVPSLAVELLRIANRRPAIEIITGRNGVEAVKVGDIALPTDRRGRVYPHFARPRPQTHISASALLDGRVDPASLEGNIVLLGVTGLGLTDVKQTPVGLVHGVEVHAQILEAALTGDLLRRTGLLDRLEPLIVLLAGLVVLFGFDYRRPLQAAVLQGALLIGLVACAFVAFRFGSLLVDTIYPAYSTTGLFAVMLGASLRAAEAAKRRLAGELQLERDAKARMEGELNAARAIQMGLVPRRFPPFPGRTDIDVFALIEPARTVGGDLYDFALLDNDRLYFSIGDVSGKGMPAALFMAMTREVLHSSALRHDGALDQVLAEANAKISAASADMLSEGGNMMFATAFAGILDLSTGELVFASAGHDAPIRLRAESAPESLEVLGGPPLGCVDDFPFPLERARLLPGDTLLLFTDGVTEAEDPARALYSSSRLMDLLHTDAPRDPTVLVRAVRDDLRRFVATAEQADDITMLAIAWPGPAPRVIAP